MPAKLKVDRRRMLEDNIVSAVAKKLGITDWRSAPEELKQYLLTEVHAMMATGKMSQQDLSYLTANAKKIQSDLGGGRGAATVGRTPAVAEYTPMPPATMQRNSVPELTVNNAFLPMLTSPGANSHAASDALPTPSSYSTNGTGNVKPKFVRPMNEKAKTLAAIQRRDLDTQLNEREELKKKSKMEAELYAVDMMSDVNTFQRNEELKEQKKREQVVQWRVQQEQEIKRLEAQRKELLNKQKELEMLELKEIEMQTKAKQQQEQDMRLRQKEVILSQMKETFATLDLKKQEEMKKKEDERKSIDEAIAREENIEKQRQATRHLQSKRQTQMIAKQEVIYKEMLEIQKAQNEKMQKLAGLELQKVEAVEKEKEKEEKRREEQRLKKKAELGINLEIQIAERDLLKRKEEEENKQMRSLIEKMAQEEAEKKINAKNKRLEQRQQLTLALENQIQNNDKRSEIPIKIARSENRRQQQELQK